MKCPQCSRNHRLGKYGMKCGCNYHFCFNPKAQGTLGLTDGKFLGWVRAASQNDTTYFTRNQLYAVYCRRLRKSPVTSLVIGGVLLILAAGIYFTISPQRPGSDQAAQAGIAFFFGVAGIIIIGFGQYIARQAIPRQDFDFVLGRWLGHGRKLDRLLEQPSLHEPPPEWNELDIYDYGVERLLIVEHDLLVDLFVKNGVHAEQRMLVISESGYPDYLMEVARRLLDEQPDLPVFLLHDATAHGTAMQERLLSSGMLPVESHPLVYLGMRPLDFRKLKRTKQFDRANSNRHLPVDALLLPFMAMGLGVAMTEQMAFSAIIEGQDEGGISDDFG